MIVQTATDGTPRFVVTMSQHTAFSGQLARAFGNAAFEAPEPGEEMFYVVAHHDQGWAELDARPGRDPETGLPWHLVDSPQDYFLRSGAGSPDFNEAHHAFCGLLSSMHIWGLYNRRYGFSDLVLLDHVPGEFRPRFNAMLDDQLARQARLKAVLAERPETAAWIEPDRLMQNYKQLQFFDTMALYFQCTAPTERSPSEFQHVPMTATEDATVTVTPVDEETYRLDPYPFREEALSLSFEGRYLDGVAGDDDALAAALAAASTQAQKVRFVGPN